MKLSVSLPADDVELIDQYARASGLHGRSAVIQHALRLLREAGLERDYATAWEEWETAGEQSLWDSVVGDGVTDAPR
ncbi:ribbon-helix-helix domain-containing protein [Modestobacter sp. VKM Ac-2979]|uniref:ribbon-helix-helix domain-containing protein n=1 Tax=unclassified Modestobacter TaxID=2643866 RepID=UPI0022AB723F|nr:MULTISPECIES: ribbon-helix-helix domain-containing protein [unclassified Modestobacter]MCZ2813818.1 ribbon-helix-helix domain-containing protein [Modestobacter sp. VKM Ac-2979]MCZ2844207.1 ribbon-helix-helix domain-containing protein [Modestobacter sp. VKM Ac-2980]